MRTCPCLVFKNLASLREPRIALAHEFLVANGLRHAARHADLSKMHPPDMRNDSEKVAAFKPVLRFVAFRHADNPRSTRTGSQVHGENRIALYGVIELSEKPVVPGAAPHPVNHIHIASAVERRLRFLCVPGGRHGHFVRGRPDGASSKHPRGLATGVLVRLVRPQRRERGFRKEIHERKVAVKTARYALDLWAGPRALVHPENPVFFVAPIADRWLRLRPDRRLRYQVKNVDQRIA
ncbi:MAG: hypothetical protein BWY06_02345 [Candidatus Latescibacteria bacterium ADurb.Bin168]|nr:MAG: hypothetical protein BWY06_02345 [Candidatus Latescibacteria bacterium ADurb.Bin168]